jgi:hypothetical protein
MKWEEFRRSDPELAALGEERFNSTGLILLDTLRKNCWPRISPVEPLITDGHLDIGWFVKLNPTLGNCGSVMCSQLH